MSLPLLLLGCAAETLLALDDGHNYSYEGSLSVERFSLAAGEAWTVRWPTLDRDLVGAPIAPSDIDRVQLVAFPSLGPDEITEQLAADELLQSAVSLYLVCEPVEAGCDLDAFTFSGRQYGISEQFQEDAATWLVALSSYGRPQALAFAEARAGGASAFEIDRETSALSAQIDLRSATPVQAGPGDRVDWSRLSTDALGHPLDPWSLDVLQIARYGQDLESIEALGAGLEAAAEAIASLDIAGRQSASLDEIDPEIFDGEPGDTWLIGLSCSTCLHPAPRFLGALEVW